MLSFSKFEYQYHQDKFVLPSTGEVKGQTRCVSKKQSEIILFKLQSN